MWKPYNNDKAPEVDGFSIGTHPNGSQIFIGRAANGEIGEYQSEFGPGRISVKDPVGFFYLDFHQETEVKSGVEYMSVSKSCKCKFITSHGENIPYALTIYNKFEYHYWWIGRRFFTKNGFGERVLLAKIRPDEKEITILEANGTSSVGFPPYDVLSCEPPNGNSQIR